MNQALVALQPVAGPSYAVLFLKMGVADWTPVGEEMLRKVIPGKNNTAAVVICDADGNSKAMSAWLPADKAAECSKSLGAKGITEFEGEVKLPI